jgi:hypothetical protein
LRETKLSRKTDLQVPQEHDDCSVTAVFYATMLIFGSVALVAFVYAIVDTITLLELP